jgi:DNA-binding CsgD family transcriptional regulator
MNITTDKVLKLAQSGLGTVAIARKLNLSAPTIVYYKTKIRTERGIDLRLQLQKRVIDWRAIQNDIDCGIGHLELCRLHGVAKGTITSGYKRGLIARPKMASELKLAEYLALWHGRPATTSFTSKVKRFWQTELKLPLACNECNLMEWRGQPAPIELDHIDGDNTNHALSNLRLLCLHCHTQTPTFGWRNQKVRTKLGRP